MLRIVRVLAPNPSPYTLEGTNTWIVGGDPAIVIDPGPDDLPGHLAEVARTAGPIGAVLVTHDHPDHAPGAAAFAAEVGAPLYAFRLRDAQHLRDGQVVRAGPVALTAVHTPGHTSDHVVFFEPTTRALFSGDTVVGRGTTFIDPPDGDLTRYLRSLHRMQELGPRTIYPGHGPVVLDGPAKLDEYVAHRAEREAQILAALGEGDATIADLVATIYAAYPPDVHPLAARSVLAHLLKLEAEGRVEHTGSGDAARYRAHAPRTCDRCGRRPAQGRSRYCGPCSLALLQDTAGPA
jgi:glyoxylase-like metal-dependent hydrolase (beta-lactamase superfamily II)